jgi:hypothetical protein
MPSSTFSYFCVNSFLAFLSVPQDVRIKLRLKLDSNFNSLYFHFNYFAIKLLGEQIIETLDFYM